MEFFWTCFTEFATTTLSILASACIAYLTFCSQEKKAIAAQKRVQDFNKQTVVELFQAAISNLLFFLTEGSLDFSKQNLSLYCKKLKMIELSLADMKDIELPDEFISSFQYYRYLISDVQISMEHIIQSALTDPLPKDAFQDLDIEQLISDLSDFVSKYK